MASITKYRSKWLKYHKGYEKRAYKELQKVFKKYTNKVVNTNFTDKKRVKKKLEKAISENNMFKTYNKIYFNMCVDEWKKRGYNNNMKYEEISGDVIYPPWVGDANFHLSHKSNLLRKQPDHYSKYFLNIPYDLPYIWPSS